MKKLTVFIMAMFLMLTSNCLSLCALEEDDIMAKKAIENGVIVETTDDMKNLANNLGNFEVVTYEIIEQNHMTRGNNKEMTKTQVTYFLNKDDIPLETRGTGDKNYNEDILSHSFNIYSTISYTTSYDEGKDFVRLDKVSGGIKRMDNAWTIYSQLIRYGCTGNYYDHPFDGSQVKEHEIGAKSTYSYTVPSTWFPVSVMDDVYEIGVVHCWEIGRTNGAIYTGEVQNKY